MGEKVHDWGEPLNMKLSKICRRGAKKREREHGQVKRRGD